jgi:hypothetical protein
VPFSRWVPMIRSLKIFSCPMGSRVPRPIRLIHQQRLVLLGTNL